MRGETGCRAPPRAVFEPIVVAEMLSVRDEMKRAEEATEADAAASRASAQADGARTAAGGKDEL